MPTLKEAGIEMPDTSWFSVAAPKGSPAEAIARVAAELEKALAAPTTRDQLLKFGQYARFIGPDTFPAQVRASRATFGELIQQAGIKLD